MIVRNESRWDLSWPGTRARKLHPLKVDTKLSIRKSRHILLQLAGKSSNLGWCRNPWPENGPTGRERAHWAMKGTRCPLSPPPRAWLPASTRAVWGAVGRHPEPGAAAFWSVSLANVSAHAVHVACASRVASACAEYLASRKGIELPSQSGDVELVTNFI